MMVTLTDRQRRYLRTLDFIGTGPCATFAQRGSCPHSHKVGACSSCLQATAERLPATPDKNRPIVGYSRKTNAALARTVVLVRSGQ